MSQFPQDDVIRITAADLASPHVDDLLNRQAALRGDVGIGRSRRRAWYYSNWFVFMLAGGLGALLAWAIIEPYMEDCACVRGTVEEIQIVANGQGPFDAPIDPEFARLFRGSVRVNGQLIVLLEGTRRLDEPIVGKPLDPSDLKAGQEVAFYVEPVVLRGGEIAPNKRGGPAGGRAHDDSAVGFAEFADLNPPPDARPTPPLRTLAAVNQVLHFLFFPAVAAMIGLFVGAADGLVCRLWRRVLLAGLVGLVVAFVGGFFTSIIAQIVYGALSTLAFRHAGQGVAGLTPLGFLIQLAGRSLGWGLAGMAMGLGQGIALRSGRLLLYGFLGGTIGGLLGGLLFDPIHFFLVGENSTSGHLSRLVGLVVIGAGVGAMIGIVELLARDAWLRMVEGPLSGKEFLVFKDTLSLGSSPRSDVYLFNDDGVAARHAVIRAAADQYEIEAADTFYPLLVNGRAATRQRLRHGDQITLGRTTFVFQRRRTEG